MTTFTFYKLVDKTVTLTPLVPEVINYVVSESTTFHVRGDMCVRKISKENKNYILIRSRFRKKFGR